MPISKGQSNVNIFPSKKNTNPISNTGCLLEFFLGTAGRKRALNSESKTAGAATATRNSQFT